MPDPRRSAAKQELRARIRQVALELFEAHGFDAVTVERVAEGSGVSPMTVFRHFGTKAGIVFDERAADLAALRAAAQHSDPGDDPRRRVVAALQRFAGVREAELWTLRSQIVAQSPTLQRLAVASRSECERALLEGLSGAVPDAATRIAAVAGLSAFHVAVQQWGEDRSRPLREVVAEAFAQLWPDLC